MGPAIATQILLNSDLKNRFQLLHIDTTVNESLTSMGKWSLKKLIRNYSIYFRFLKVCMSQKPDLVLIPISQSTIGFVKDSWFIWIAWITGRKALIQLRGSNFRNWINSSGFLIKKYVKTVLKRSDGVIVLGNNLKALFEGYFTDKKIYVSPNGGNYTFPERTARGNVLNLLYLGNLQASKGIEDVIEAVRILNKKTCLPFQLTALGGWRNEQLKLKLLSLIEKEDLKIHFIPPEQSTEKLQLLANADIFVFTPREPEGHPWVIVESMAAGLPVISTDKGAITECVINDQNGFIVADNSPESIAEKLLLLIENKPLREKMGQESRAYYLEKFTEEKMVERYTHIFQTAICS